MKLRIRTDYEILMDSLKGGEGYWACHTCKVTHPLFKVNDVLEYYEDKHEFQKRCIFYKPTN